ncbi:hypothetical protein C0Q70_10835 [Pomacea canaliculata]|uniref:Sulfatase N-terminal domain-containing protein n=1 Tax=Pomacea canaliculata TaxID=400727 RepID=A0A2T7P4B1_POMCA|nr:hypothetical protein C0Q70_10835 [Pomacea canaliculata]
MVKKRLRQGGGGGGGGGGGEETQKEKVCMASSDVRDRSKQPNIVLVVADDYGYNDISYHGSRIRTPNLERLANHGVKLENYYVQPICTPSRCQLMSGRYQIHTGLQHSIIWPGQPNGLPLDSPTLADKLREAGYATHAVGKWHLGMYKKEFLPTNRGFDSFYGLYLGSGDHYSHRSCLGPGCGLDLHNNTEPDFSKDQVPEKYTEQYQDIPNKARRKFAGMVTCMDEGITVEIVQPSDGTKEKVLQD